MKLLGSYRSSLQAFHYQELLELYKQAIANGDFAGNKTFDVAAINSLIKQSEDFQSLPLASAGQRVTDDSLNNPLDILTARFNALVSEANSFNSRAANLISIIEKDTNLLDIQLAAAKFQEWLSERPLLNYAEKFSWDFGMGIGPVSFELDKEDPSNSVIYNNTCITNTYLDVVNNIKSTGLSAPVNKSSIIAKNLTWFWDKMTSGEQSEDIYGDGWAELNLLEDRPILNFLPNPATNVILPIGGNISGIFSINGQVKGGALPIYIRTSFVPRRNNITLIPNNVVTDGSFESSGIGWVFSDLWNVVVDSNVHSGTKYANKSAAIAWSSLVRYHIGDIVYYLGNQYKSAATNLNQAPNAPNSVYWTLTGTLKSPVFPLNPSDIIYVEGWLKNLSADGTLSVSLTCIDHAGNELSPAIFLPGETSADSYIKTSGVLQALASSNVVAGRIGISVFGHTTGHWAVDDVRVHLPQNLSAYTVNRDEVSVYIPKTGNSLPQQIYFANEAFITDDSSNVTFMDVIDGIPLTVRFTEEFPAYQCSINEKAWSPIVMLDSSRPYPDTETAFNPIAITMDTDSKALFPITDELGIPTGLTMKVISRPLFQYYFQVTTPTTPQYGATALLEIDLAKPTYIDGLSIAPFSTYPLRLTKIETESFTADTRQIVGIPNALIDQPMILTFPRTLLRKIYLTFYQENYNLAEHVVQPSDSLRRDTLFSLQTVLPFNVRRSSRAVPIYYNGAQYTIGVEDLAGINITPILPGIFISGPNRFDGCPDVFRYDIDVIDENSTPQFETYLCWKAYNSSNILINSQLTGILIDNGDCKIWPFPSLSALDRSTVDHVDIFLKFVFRNKNVTLQRYLLQVSNV